nr:MAG TPA: hypothetical protein [Caudoviricetes sp.]
MTILTVYGQTCTNSSDMLTPDVGMEEITDTYYLSVPN